MAADCCGGGVVVVATGDTSEEELDGLAKRGVGGGGKSGDSAVETGERLGSARKVRGRWL